VVLRTQMTTMRFLLPTRQFDVMENMVACVDRCDDPRYKILTRLCRSKLLFRPLPLICPLVMFYDFLLNRLAHFITVSQANTLTVAGLLEKCVAIPCCVRVSVQWGVGLPSL
jgi:hypothetical protein